MPGAVAVGVLHLPCADDAADGALVREPRVLARAAADDEELVPVDGHLVHAPRREPAVLPERDLVAAGPRLRQVAGVVLLALDEPLVGLADVRDFAVVDDGPLEQRVLLRQLVVVGRAVDHVRVDGPGLAVGRRELPDVVAEAVDAVRLVERGPLVRVDVVVVASYQKEEGLAVEVGLADVGHVTHGDGRAHAPAPVRVLLRRHVGDGRRLVEHARRLGPVRGVGPEQADEQEARGAAARRGPHGDGSGQPSGAANGL